MSTNYVQYDFKDGNKTDRFMLKLVNDKIEDLFEVKHSERANPDDCLEYRLCNGAIKAEFVGSGADEFVSAMLRERGENCRFHQYNVREDTFKRQRMLENMLTIRGESTGLRFLKERTDTLAHETRHYQNLKWLETGCIKR